MARHSYDPPRPNPNKIVYLVTPGQRYCETCRSYQPKGNRPAVKGWKCENCRTGKPAE